MTSRVILPKKSTLEDLEVLFGFQDQMTFGTSINGVAVNASVYSGVDPSPATILDGLPVLQDTYYIKQNITGGLQGVTYLLTCVVTTSNALELSRQAYLSVLNPATEF